MADNYNNIPAQLKALPNWVGFRIWLEEKDGKLKKMPIDIKATIAAKKADFNQWKDLTAECNNPKTWCDFDTALAWLKAKKPHKKYTYHIGFAFDGSGIVGIDLDHCVGEDKELSDFAKEVLAAVPSYAEYSPSGTGVHILANCSELFPGGGLHRPDIEMYQSGRFFTMTGNVLEGSAASIADCTDAIMALYEKHKNTEQDAIMPLDSKQATAIHKLKLASTVTDGMADDEVIRRAKESRRQGAKFSALYSGDWQSQGFPSQSEADMAFCMSLAFWTGKDYAQIDRIFRSSGLYRDKWDKVHYAGGITYGEHTVAEAIDKCTSEKAMEAFPDNTIVYSMWTGYLDKSHPAFDAYKNEFIERAKAGGSKFVNLHTSGHATTADIKRVCDITQAKLIIPIHSEKPEAFECLGINGEVRVLQDGELLTL